MKAVVLNNPQRSFLFFLQAFQPIKMSKQPLVGDIAPSSPMSPSSFAARQWQTSVPPPLFPIPTPIENPLSAHLFASCVLRLGPVQNTISLFSEKGSEGEFGGGTDFHLQDTSSLHF